MGPGWTFRKSGGLEVRREGCATVYGVPYSEHSNFEVPPAEPEPQPQPQAVPPLPYGFVVDIVQAGRLPPHALPDTSMPAPSTDCGTLTRTVT